MRMSMTAMVPNTVTMANTWIVSKVGNAHGDSAMKTPREEFWMASQSLGKNIVFTPLTSVRRP